MATDQSIWICWICVPSNLPWPIVNSVFALQQNTALIFFDHPIVEFPELGVLRRCDLQFFSNHLTSCDDDAISLCKTQSVVSHGRRKSCLFHQFNRLESRRQLDFDSMFKSVGIEEEQIGEISRFLRRRREYRKTVRPGKLQYLK